MANHRFTKGSKVEVSSADEGFKGAWYVATIIERPKSGECLIEFETLVEDGEGPEPLIERVHVSYIRPLPPPPADGGGCFEVNDIVDAFYRDGWWTGVVARVVEGSGSFLITFENPPDEIEFNRSELRVHMEWVDGKWEMPQKKSMTGMTFYKGAAVEVSLQKKEFHNGWCLGTILRVTENNNFLVDYQCSEVGKKPVNRKVNVDSLQIRPSPPRLEDKEFVLMDEVEAYYDFCWWSGVINRHLEDGRYIVLVKHAKEEKEFYHSDLRPRMDWTDGKWIIVSRETKQVAMLHDQSIKWSRQKRRARKPQAGRHCDLAKGYCYNVEEIVEKECIAEEFEMSSKEVKGARAENPCETPGKAPSKFVKDQEQQIANPEIQVTDEINGSSNKQSNQKKKRSKKRGRPPKSMPEKQIGDGSIRAEGVSREMVVKDCAVNKVELNAGMDHLKLMTNDDKPDEDQFQLSSNKCMRLIIGDKKLLSGLQRHNDILSIRNVPLAENDNQANEKVARKRVKRCKKTVSNGQGQGSTTVDSECQIQDCQDVSRGKTSEGNEMFSEKNDDKILIDEFFADTNDDQPLLMWFKGASPVGSLGQSAKAIDKKDENEIPSSSIATNDSMNSSTPQKTITNDSDSGAMLAGNLNQCSEASDREGELGTPSAAIVISDSVDQSLPFVKCSPIWKTIESMEIFHKTPQKPHFSPLVNCNEDVREGLAIAQMVTFSNLMERTSKLRFSDPSSSIKRSLETLIDLELHGFEVEAVRVHLNDLLSKKDRERELQSEYKNVENEITKSNLEKAKFEQEIDKIQLKMRGLAEKLAAVASMKEIKEQEISTLGSKLDAIRENIKSIQLDYEYV